MSRTSVMTAGAVLCCLTAILPATACSFSSERPAPARSSTPSLIEPSGPNDVDTDVPSPAPSPTWDAASREQATERATAVMLAFVDHSSDPAAWWKAIEPMFSPQAGADYAGTDPAQVPARQVTGPAVLVDESSAFLATVEVPTDVGAYQVLLSRVGAGTPWLVERLTPPVDQGSG